MKLVIQPQAQADLDAVPERLFPRLWRRIEVLRRHPGLGAPLEGPFQDLRSIVFPPYRIVYQERRGAVVICYVRHGRRA